MSHPMDNRHDGLANEDISRSYGNYDIVQRNHVARTYARNESRSLPASYSAMNSNVASQMIMESIYGPQTVSKMLQNSEELNGDLNRKSSDLQNIEMTPFKGTSTGHQQDMDLYAFHGSLSKSQDLQRVSQYIQSLPELPVYESELQARSNREPMLFASAIQEAETKVAGESASSPIPPPPAPPDPPQEIAKKSSPTTGERIFSALRSVTAQSYIDASEFYK